MIVWGGMSGNLDNGTWYNTGGRYNPVSNTWTATSLAGAPSPRIWHVDAWTGVEMIVWSGCTGNTSCWDTLLTGGRYNLATDSWTSTSLGSVPRERANAAAVWTGEGLLVWGGFAGDVGTYTTTGGLYSVSYGPNTPPAAFNDAYSTDEDVQLVVPAPGVLANDTDADGDTLTALLVSNPIHGSLDLSAGGSFTYTPDLGFSGSDSFSYRATDGTAQSGIATVTLTVNATNDAPVATDDSYWLPANTTLNAPAPGVLSNDSDPDGDPLSAVLVSGPASGSLTLNADGSFSYTPVTDFAGTDTFTYRASDGSLQSAETTVTLTVIDDLVVFRFYLPAVNK
jgi:VCBS repeat-containing protein